jgi:leishmanolysin-like peptidase
VCRGADGSTDFRYQLNAVIHEMFHALGFSSSLFSMWRNSDGELYDSGTPRTHSRTCFTHTDAVGCSAFTVTQTFNERNRTVTKLITPTALSKARQFFNCSTLNGVELENQVPHSLRVRRDARRVVDTAAGAYVNVH